MKNFVRGVKIIIIRGKLAFYKIASKKYFNFPPIFDHESL